MTFDELHQCLLNNLSQQFTKVLAREAVNDSQLMPQLIDTMFNARHPINWRAAWVVDHIYQYDKSLTTPYIPQFVKGLFQCNNNGVKRHLLKLVSLGPMEHLEDGNLIDLCFKWLQAVDTPIASRAHCMHIIFRLIAVYPELANELELILPDIIQNGSKGEKNKASRILQKIKGKYSD
jgi:hypothetical protein